MDRLERSGPSRPPEWQPLVSPRQWTILAQAFRDRPEALDDLRVVSAQLSPGVRGALIDNVLEALASHAGLARAVWHALAITGDEVSLSSASALGRLHRLGDDAPLGVVKPLRPED